MNNKTIINYLENMESEVMDLEDAKHNCELLKQMGVDCDIKDFLGKRFPRVDEVAMCH